MDDLVQWARGSGLEIVLIALGSQLVVRLVTFAAGEVTSWIDQHAGDAAPANDLGVLEAAKHRHALTQLLRWSVVVLVDAAALLLILKRFGIPIATFVAPATVAGVALGFGAQQVVRDFLSGFFIVAERQYGYGDVIRIPLPGSATVTTTGTVEDVTLRVTRIRTSDGEVVMTPNSEIRQVTNLSRGWARAVVDVPVPTATDTNAVVEQLDEVCDAAFADARLRPLLLDRPTVMGIETLDVASVSIRVVARTMPGRQFEVTRALRTRIAAVVSELDIDPTRVAAGAASA